MTSLKNSFNTRKKNFFSIGDKFVNCIKKKYQVLGKIVFSAYHYQQHLKKQVTFSDCQFNLGQVGLYHLKGMFLDR